MRGPAARRLDGRKLDGLVTSAVGRGLLAEGYQHLGELLRATVAAATDANQTAGRQALGALTPAA